MQVSRVGPAFGTTPEINKPAPASHEAADAYRSDWLPPRVSPALHALASAQITSPQRADPELQVANDEALERASTQGAQPLHLAPVPAVMPAAQAAAARFAANEAAPDPRQVHVDALLAQDVYNDVPNPPPGYRAASDADLAKLGLDPHMLEQPGESSFRARVYVSGEPGQEHYTVAFRGSESGDDWKSNIEQGLGLDSAHYANALEIGKKLARSDADVTLVGHSLGGGLAAEAAIASGRDAVTFNAAGLHAHTIAEANAVAEANDRGAASVNNYRVPGEILSWVQEHDGPLDLPDAYGAQHDLPNVRPEGAHWWDSINPIDRHGIDWVLAGTAAQARG